MKTVMNRTESMIFRRLPSTMTVSILETSFSNTSVSSFLLMINMNTMAIPKDTAAAGAAAMMKSRNPMPALVAM